MAIYQREPYRSEMAGTIANLILRQGQAQASGARQVADIQAQAALERGRNRAQLFGSLGDIASNAVAGYFQHKQREQEMAPRREMEQLTLDSARRESDAAREADWNRRKGLQAVGQALKAGDYSVLDELPPEIRQVADGYLADRAKLKQAQTQIVEAKRARKAKAIRDFGYNVDAAELVMGMDDDDPEGDKLFQSVRNDPAKLRQLVDHYAGPVKATFEQEDPTKRTVRIGPNGERKVLSEGVPEVKLDARSLDIRIADAAAKGDRATYNQLMSVKRALAAAGRDPDANAKTDEPLVAVIGDDGQPVLMERSKAAGRRPASNREQGRPVPAATAGTLAELQTSLDDTEKLRVSLGTTGAGSKIGAMLPDVVTEFTGWGEDSKSRQGVIDRVKQVIGKALEGGVLRKEDEYKYTKILPTIGDPPAVAKSKLEGLTAALKLRQQRAVEALSDAGYDVAAFEARQPQSEPAPTTTPVAPASASGRVKVTGPNGQTGTVPKGSALPPGWSVVR